MRGFIPIVLLIVILFTSCSENITNPVTESGDITVPAEYDGYEFITLTRDFADDDPWRIYEIDAEHINGEVLNDSIVQRDLEIEERWNINLSKIIHTNPASYAYTNIMAETHAFDVMMSSLFDCSQIAQSGMAYDLFDIDYMDMTNPWWDQSAVRDLSIGDRLYYVTGDFSYRNYNAPWIYVFNKNIVDGYSLENPYNLVSNGTWTIDKFGEMIHTVNGSARYGLITEGANTLGMFIGTGNTVISKINDYPVISLSTERGVTAIEKILRCLNNESVINVNSPEFVRYTDDLWQGVVETFTSDRALFYSTVMYSVYKLRGMDSDFGILPMPKFDESQEAYYTWVSPWIASGVVIPASSPDVERTGRILEDIAYESSKIVKPAYYDVTLEGKFTRDVESADMIDIVLANRVYDLSMLYDWNGIGSLLSVMSTEYEHTFTSRYATVIKNAEFDLANVIKAYRGL
jgi:hypothetical protein